MINKFDELKFKVRVERSTAIQSSRRKILEKNSAVEKFIGRLDNEPVGINKLGTGRARVYAALTPPERGGGCGPIASRLINCGSSSGRWETDSQYSFRFHN